MFIRFQAVLKYHCELILLQINLKFKFLGMSEDNCYFFSLVISFLSEPKRKKRKKSKMREIFISFETTVPLNLVWNNKRKRD